MFAVRPTEIAESDVFVCESTYDELKKQIRRNHPGTGLRKFKHSQLVTQDEIYHFKRPIAPAKVKYNQSLHSIRTIQRNHFSFKLNNH